MANSVKIKLIKIFSPCEFYFHFQEGNYRKQQDVARAQVAHIEKRIRQEVSKKEPIKDAEIGRIVTCHVNHWNKYVRAKVLNQYHNGEYEVLVFDYGYKMDMRRVYDLPEKFRENFQLVKKGSLGVSPLEYWSEPVKNLCKDLNKNKNIECRFVLTCKEGDLYIGDIFVFSPSGNFSLTDRVKEYDEGVVSECNFKKIYETLTKASLPKPLNPHKKIEVNKELDLASISEILFHQNNFEPPPTLIINGKELKAPWESVDKTLFDSLIKKEISKVKLNDIQMFMWPQIHSSYRHAIIISNQYDSTPLYLPALLNNIYKNPTTRSYPEFMGPIAIIFVHNLTRADEVSKMCLNILKNVKLVKAAGMCENKKVDIINGCEILVTTPSAFTRLTKNICLKIIDTNRLKHVAFDAYHLISSRYENDIDRIMKFCTVESEKVPQIIFTSGIFASDIKQKFLCRIPREKTVACFDSFIDAAVFAGIEIRVEICKNFDEKVAKLLEVRDFKNSVVVTNDAHIGMLKDILSSTDAVVIADSLIENSTIRNVENLIHFSSGKNWKAFVNRFALMYDKIHDKLDGRDVKLTTTVLFEEQNIPEFEALITFMVDRKLYKGNPRMLEKIRFNRESAKCEKNIRLCGKLLQFGICNDQYCADRHILSASDKCFDYFTNNYVKFNLVSMISPIEFTVKIQEYCKNGQWMSLKYENATIEKKLDDLQKYCGDGENLKIKEGKIGEIYAKYDANEKQWLRAKIIERSSPTILKLQLIDRCGLSHALEAQLIKIPKEIASLPPLMQKLRIINLVPLDGNLCYTPRDAAVLENEIKDINQNSVITCKVSMAFNDTIFTDNFEARNSKNVVKFRLKSTHLKLGLSEVDESIGKNLAKLFAKDEIISEPQKIKKEIIMKEQKHKPLVEMWKELKFGKSYQIILAHYISPYSFFVLIESSENFVLKAWMKKIEEFKDIETLKFFKPGTSCLLVKNGVNKRAKILSFNEDQVELLLVDFGEIVSENKANLFELPEEFGEFRYQAVHCSLKGIKPKFNMKFWPSMQKSVIHKLMKERQWILKVIEGNEKFHQFGNTKINSYEVVLFDDCEFLHEVAIENLFASRDENFIVQSNSEEASTDIIALESESEEQIKSQSESGYRSSESEQNTGELPSFNAEGLKKLMEFYQKTIEGELNVESSPIISKSIEDTKPTLLTNLYKHPYIKWRQNEFYLYLIITAKDCINYAIQLDEFTADVAIFYPEKKVERAVLHLYGIITPKLCSHNLSGGNIILRLAKQNIQEWPRLTEDKSFSTYIKFCDEEVPYTTTKESTSSISTTIFGRPAGISDDESESESSENKYFTSDEDD